MKNFHQEATLDCVQTTLSKFHHSMSMFLVTHWWQTHKTLLLVNRLNLEKSLKSIDRISNIFFGKKSWSLLEKQQIKSLESRYPF